MWYVRTYVTNEDIMSGVRTYIRSCRKRVMSELILHTKIWFLVSEFTLHMKTCNVRTYVTHEYEMCSVRTYGTYEKCDLSETMLHTKICCPMTKLMFHTKMCISWTYVTHEKSLRKSDILCYTQKYDVLYPESCYIQKCVMYERKYEMISARTYEPYENLICHNLCYILK